MNGEMCNDCYLSMQNCHDMSICCEMEEYYGDRCDSFEPIPEPESGISYETYYGEFAKVQ